MLAVMQTRARVLIVLLLVAWAHGACAQGGPPMITDDPGTPGDGRWEINIAAINGHSDSGSTTDLPRADINFGLGERIQLKYEVPWEIDHGAFGSRSGVGDSLFGVKWRFEDQERTGWGISTYPQSTVHAFPGGGAASRASGPASSTLLPLEFEHALGGYDLDFEVGRWFRPAPQTGRWIAGLVLGHDVGHGVEWLLEWHAEGDAGWNHSEQVLNLGVRVDLSDRFTFLASLGRDLRNTLAPLQDRMAYGGVQLHL